MKNKKIIGLTLLSALLISGCTYANGETTPIKNSTNTPIKDSTNTSTNTESVESENYQYYPLSDGTLAIAVGNNRDLQYLTIPKTHHGKMVTQIADNGFANCTALKQINLPDSINVIGEKAFSGCSSLNFINIPDSTSVIGNYAFEGCKSLTSVVIPDSVTSIGNEAFYGCSLLRIYCAAEKQPEGWNCDWNRDYSGRVITEWGCEGGGTYLGLVYRIDIINGERVATILRYRGTESKLTIPGVIEGMKVVGIGGGAFYGCSSLTSVVIPEGVTSIGGYAFRGCSSLISVTIPDSVTSIGDNAFEGCSSLTSVVIPEGVTSIGNSAFYGCSSLTSVVIPGSVTSIGYEAFSGCKSLASVVIPGSVTSIGYRAFEGCSSLASVVIPGSVTSIGWDAFEGCSSLTIYCAAEKQPEEWDDSWNSSYRPVGWGCVGYGASDSFLYGISKINNDTYAVITEYRGADTNIRIPETINGVKVAAIGDGAFSGCESLTSVVIPKGVTSIGNSAFYRCSSLTSVVIPEGVTLIGNWAFRGCSSLTSIVIPEGVTSIGEYAFSFCESLTICCVAEKQPEGWDDDWNPSNRPVVWGYKSKP